MSILVGLTTIGSEAQRVASRPAAGLSILADSSGFTCAWTRVGVSRTASVAAESRARRGVITGCIGGNSWGRARRWDAGGREPDQLGTKRVPFAHILTGRPGVVQDPSAPNPD